jgi:hypothetical protein
VDDGFSGTNLRRPGIADLLERANMTLLIKLGLVILFGGRDND